MTTLREISSTTGFSQASTVDIMVAVAEFIDGIENPGNLIDDDLAAAVAELVNRGHADWLGTHGLIEVDPIECAYCLEELPAGEHEIVPAPNDDDEWERIAAYHAPQCEWITTRAHRVFANAS